MLVVYLTMVDGKREATAIRQEMNGCVCAALDRHLDYELSDCVWIVPGTFDAFA